MMVGSDEESAVLEVSEAGADSSGELAGESEDVGSPQAEAPAPLLMEPGYDIAVKVDAPMKQLSTLETFVTYRVRSVCPRWQAGSSGGPAGSSWVVRRRYNQFRALRARLCCAAPQAVVPPLPPPHSPAQQLDRYAHSFVALRTLGLDFFLNRVAHHPVLSGCEELRAFLSCADEQVDRLLRADTSFSLWGLTSALYPAAPQPSAPPSARVTEPALAAGAEYLESVQHKLTALALLSKRLYRGVAHLAHHLDRMQAACEAWAGGERGCARAAARGVALGARGAAAACSPRPAAPPAAQLAAAPPLLAAHAALIAQAIRAAHHGQYSTGNSSDNQSNRLEQPSEALKAELSDWMPKTRADIKRLLLNLADDQIAMHSQSLAAWEKALEVCKAGNIQNAEELFKTVSKTAVSKLSPSKSGLKSDSNTEKDLDFDLDSDALGAESLEYMQNRLEMERADSMSNLSGDWDDVKPQDVKRYDLNEVTHDGTVANERIPDVRVYENPLSENGLEEESRSGLEEIEDDGDLRIKDGELVKTDSKRSKSDSREYESGVNENRSGKKGNGSGTDEIGVKTNGNDSGTNANGSEANENGDRAKNGFSDPLNEMAEIDLNSKEDF